MIWYRFGLVGLGCVAAALMTWLGLATARENILGWCVLLFGVGYFGGGAIYLAVTQSDQGSLHEKGDRSLWLLALGFAVVFFGAPLEWLFLPNLLPRGLIDQVLGLGLIVAGLLLRAWTRPVLGRHYQGHLQVRRGQRLVRQGPYRFVRHPGYTGFVLLALGLALGFSSVIALAAIPLLLLPGLAQRIWTEESLLLAAFGGEYREYQRMTKRLVPGLW